MDWVMLLVDYFPYVVIIGVPVLLLTLLIANTERVLLALSGREHVPGWIIKTYRIGAIVMLAVLIVKFIEEGLKKFGS